MERKGYLYDPKKRFSSRVENYVNYRPTYPIEIINFLIKERILSKNSIIADIGSGTGILSKLFINNFNKVYAVEPNDEMRNAAERQFINYPNFISIKGSAEKTELEDHSIDIITVGQAFHWFDIELTKIEFRRVLNENGHVVIIWNSRKKAGNKFSEDYEKIVSKYGTDYKQVRMNERIVDDFYQYQLKKFENYQDLDYNGLKGRLLSTSYIPLDNDPNFEQMIIELEELFSRNQKNGKIRFEYNTLVYYGKLT